ncbi:MULTISPECIES: PadR family transcriptional regulator [unclassified Sphingomonas]|uniref:PadR family transcriptional regulator n=1 Tax=unclassified Sphingomonas TaxID=196159 RepID=UPI00226A0DF2|nr:MULTISPECIES: PadR family transcriptional regulator [unclassified Sphingomonas]
MFHMHGRDGGPRGGRFERGPFSMSWEIHGERHGGRHGGGRGDGGGRSRRMFDGGELRLVLLKLIAAAPRHGYDLIREIETMTGGAYAPSPGVVYPTLTLLGDMGLIAEQASEGAKKLFAATEEGRTHLGENADQVEALVARLTGLGSERSRPDHAPIRRAMGALHQATRDRIARGDLSEDALHDVAALIDELVRKIERFK